MYITYETISGNDPRLDSRMEYIGSFWHYTISYISPEHETDVYVKWLNGVEISENVAKSYKFMNALNGELSLRVSASSVNDIVHASGDTPEKILYHMNEQELSDTVELYKAIMLNYMDNHCQGGEVKEALRAKINETKTLPDIQMLMATYYDFDVAYTQGKKKKKELIVVWR